MLEKLNPREVFSYFEQICAIPHGSGNTKKITEYLLKFADENNLRAYCDKAGNVIIYVEATPGYEEHEPVILQGHMDMVCAKIADCELDMEEDGLKIQTDGEYVWADGTTLGGDDGIAVAYILAILAAKDLSHPPIEAILTADEETDMGGARGLETEYLRGRRLINIDSEEEGVLTVSCAGGVGVFGKLPINYVEAEYNGERLAALQISISDLMGGHSGSEIHKPRQNAVLLLAKMLKDLRTQYEFTIAHFQGGSKDNAIPKEAEAIICVEAAREEALEELAIAWAEEVTSILEETEPEMSMVIAGILPVATCMDQESTDRVLDFLDEVPNGAVVMSQNIDGLVQTSSNLGIAWIENDSFCTTFLIRSSVAEEKEAMKQIIQQCAQKYSGTVTYDADYPAWEYEEDSPLREKMITVYEEMYGQKPLIEAVHAGLECGFLAEKIPGLDMVSFGPNLEGVHTPDERMEVASVSRCWEYLLRLLERL